MTVFVKSRLSKPLQRSLVALLTLLAGGATQANDWLDSFQYQGFIGQGYIKTDTNNFYGNSASGSLDFHEIGINASIRPLSNLQLAGQLMSRRAGETDDGDIRVDYALADLNAISNTVSQAGLRLGRVKIPFGLYNETRDVPFTRPSIFLPQSIYFDRTRQLALSADGGQIYMDRLIDDNLLSFQLGIGQLQTGGLEYAVFGLDAPGRLDSEVSYAARLLFDGQDGLTVALTYGIADLQYKPGSPDPFGAGDMRFKPLVLSIQYDAGDWELTSEMATRSTRLSGITPTETRFIGESYYLQGIYRFNPAWQGLMRYDVLYTDRNDKDGSAYAAATGGPAYSRFAKDWTVGLRWLPHRQWMVSGEFHHVDGTAWLAVPDNPQPTERIWNMFSAEVSYRF